MSLAERLSERREKMSEDRINAFVQTFIPKVEEAVDADTTSRHIEVRLEFKENENVANLKLNDKVVETFDISNILGEFLEKFYEILFALENEGFENKTENKIGCWDEDEVPEKIYAIGFDI